MIRSGARYAPADRRSHCGAGCASRELFWGNLREDVALEKSVEVRFHDDEDYHVVGVRSPSPLFTAEVETPTASRSAGSRCGRCRRFPRKLPGDPDASLPIIPASDTLSIPMSGRVIGIYTRFLTRSYWRLRNQPISRYLMVYPSRKQKFTVLRVDPP